MKNYSFVADICGTLYGNVEAESEDDAREKLTENLRIFPQLECEKNADIDFEWDYKPKCHGNCCSFGGATDDEYGVDITEEEE